MNAMKTTPAANAVTVMVAATPEELAAAWALTRGCYLDRGYAVSESAAPAADPAETVIVAKVGAAVVGTLTLRDGARGALGAEQVFGDLVQGLRGTGRRLVELTRLAVARGWRAHRVLPRLFRAAAALGRARRAWTDVVVEVNPAHRSVYERAFGFEVLGNERVCARVKAPAYLLRADLMRLLAVQDGAPAGAA